MLQISVLHTREAFRCQASADHTTYQNKNNLNKVETFLWAIQTWYAWFKWEGIHKSLNDIPTIQRIIYMNNNCELLINTNDCLFFAKKQSLLLRTSTRSPSCKTTHRMPVWLIECLWTILVISNVFWELPYITLKKPLNCRRAHTDSHWLACGWIFSKVELRKLECWILLTTKLNRETNNVKSTSRVEK